LRRRHFETLRPVCPLCRAPLSAGFTSDELMEGIIVCTNPQCRREYPVIDGIPILVGAIRAWLAANPLQVLLRDDLSPVLESLIGDVLGPGSSYDTQRQHVGIYADDHYGGGGAASRLLQDVEGDTPLLDLGCATGGTTFRLADRGLTVGVDLNFAMLRVAAGVLRSGRARYARRRVGVVYDRVDIPVDVPNRELVDFWCCDAAALPFAEATFGSVVSLNLIDCTPAPQQVVAEIARTLRDGGQAIVSTPYDWSASATPVEHWLGGHSQRGPESGAAEPMLRRLMSDSFEIEHEDDVPWRVRLHDRSAVDYAVHLVTARRKPAPSS
jgi:SAM-dependent methyltransferase/uncharacterized protein YbaR (Trm112 family)